MLKDLIEKHAPINSTEKVDALISDMQNCRISHTNEVEIQVLYEIRKSKLQIYFKEQWQSPKPVPKVKEPKPLSKRKLLIKEMKKEIKAQSNSSLEDSFDEPIHTTQQPTEAQPQSSSEKSFKELRKEIKERAQEVLEKKKAIPDFIIESKPRVFCSNPKKPKKGKEKKTIDPFEMVERREERMAQNRDKRVQPGYSSTGVKLPTAQAMKELQEKRQHYREVYYTNKRHKDADDPKRGNGYIYIDTPM